MGWRRDSGECVQDGQGVAACQLFMESLGPARKRGMRGCWNRLAGHVISSPRASKLVGLVKPWAVRRRTWSRLFVPSMRPLEARSVWCQARISSDHAMKVSTVMLLCLSSRDLGEVLLVALGEVAVVVEASFEC